MNNKISTSGRMLGLIIFVGLMPLAFSFSQHGALPIADTPLQYFVWCGQAVVLLLLLLTKTNLSRNQLIGLATLCMLVPFTFMVDENGVSFLILNNYTSSILSWAIASVLFSKPFSGSNLNSKANY